MARDIKELVPPILKMSRKLQQDREFLDKNPWTRILPTLPEAPQVWFGQEYKPAGQQEAAAAK